MQSFFQELFGFSHHYNQALLDVFDQHPHVVSDKVNTLFCHILNAHQIWNNRIMPQESPLGVWQLHSLELCRVIDDNNHRQSLQILDTFDLSQNITYTTTQGKVFSNTVRDILFHACNHATHHRAQIATELRIAGLQPISMDYIFYKRLA